MFQELFTEIDQEQDGEIYLKEVVMYLRAMNEHMESLEVTPRNFLVKCIILNHTYRSSTCWTNMS